MTQESLLKNQVLEELLREKSNNYQINKQQKDFWILNSPNFINKLNLSEKIKNSNFYNNNKNKNDHFSCLISLDKKYIQWIELRLGYFENVNSEISDNFVSDGICGFFDYIDETNFNISPLKNEINKINPFILTKKYKKTLQLYNILA
jgi:hypothetical protein